MTALTGLDLPVGSPGGSVELIRDLYLAPDAPIAADVFMLAGTGSATEPADRTVALAVPGKHVDGAQFWAYVRALAAAIGQRFVPGDYEVLHLHHLAFGASPALLRAFPNHPSLAFVHGTDLLFAADHRTQLDVLASVAATTDAVVVPTSAMADLLIDIAPVPPRRIVHIPWGVPDRLLAAPPARTAPEGGVLRLLYAGRLTAEKGAENAIRAVADVDGAVLSVAGPLAEFDALSRRMDVTGINYLGWLTRADLWRAFADHDLLIVPSTRLEAFSLVAVEAQACGLPVAYQPVPGLAQVLGDSALAVDLAGDVPTLADTIGWLQKDPAALDDIRAAGLRNAARFPLSRTAAEVGSLSAGISR